jgi:hypothetical protein
MREETVQIETLLGSMSARLERSGGMPLADALRQMHAIRLFIAGCRSSGCENELLIAMERAGLGDFAELVLPIVR